MPSGAEGTENIYAIYDDGTIKNTIGKLVVERYTPQTQIVKIIKVKGATSDIDAAKIKTQLDEIYEPAQINFTVNIDNTAFDYTLTNGDLDVGDNATLSSYTAEMNSLKAQYFSTHDKEVNTSYIFIVPQFSKSGVLGYMPRGKNIGFIAPPAPDGGATTIAHELGHGLFGLEHTFDAIPKSSTDNLMDYANGRLLVHKQWKQIRNPGLIINWFDDVEEALILGDSYNSCTIPNNLLSTYLTNGLMIDWGGKTVNLSQAGAIPTRIFNKNEGEHEGQLSQFKIGSDIYVVVYGQTSKSYYGFAKSTLITSSALLDDTKRVENLIKCNNCGTGSLVKTNDLGNYSVFSSGIETATTIASDCPLPRPAGPDGFDPAFIDNLVKTHYSTATDYKKNYSSTSRTEIYGLFQKSSTCNVVSTSGGPTTTPSFCEQKNQNATNPAFVTAFNNFLNERDAALATANKACADITIGSISYFVADDFVQLDACAKAKVITLLGNQGVGCLEANCEDKILSILKSGDSDAKNLLDALKAQNSIPAIFAGMDDVGGNPNFTTAIKYIVELCKLAYPTLYKKDTNVPTVILGTINSQGSNESNFGCLKDVQLNGTIISGRNSITEPLFETADFVIPGTSTTLHFKVKTKDADYQTTEIESYPLPNGLDMFDPVGVVFVDKVSFLSDVCDNSCGGQEFVMPAFYLYYLNSKHNTEITKDVINGVATVAGYALGVGELATALNVASKARTILAIADLGFSAFLDATNTSAFSTWVDANYDNVTAARIKASCNAIGIAGTAIAGGLSFKNWDTGGKVSTAAANEALDALQEFGKATNRAEEMTQRTALYESFMKKWGKRVKTLTKTGQLDALERKINNIQGLIAKKVNDVIEVLQKSTSTVWAKIKGGELEILDANHKIGNASGTDPLLIDGVTQVRTPDGLVFDVSRVELSNPNNSALNVLCSGTYCFAEDTPTETGELMTAKNEGDKILTINPTTGERILSTLKSIRHSITHRLTHLLIAGSVMGVTPNHAFLNEQGNWVAAEKLHAGDCLRTPTGLVEVQDVCTETVPPTPVVSFELENNAPYFVGNMPVLAAGKCLLLTLKDKFGTDFNKFQNSLLTFNVNAAERKAIYEALDNLTSSELKIWLSDLSDPKTYNELKRILVTGDATTLSKYKGIMTDLSSDKAKMQLFREVINDPVLSYEKLKEGYNNTLKTWLEGRMWEYVRTGKDFEDYVKAAIKGGNTTLVDGIRNFVSNFNVNNYHIYSQVQINIPNTTNYFVADQILVKYTTQGVIDEVIILENKLTANTLPTTNQTAAKNASGVFSVRSQVFDLIQKPSNSPFDLANANTFDKAKVTFLRVNSNGTASGLTNVTTF